MIPTDDDGPYYWHIKSGTIQREPPENKDSSSQPAMNFQRQVVREAEVGTQLNVVSRMRVNCDSLFVMQSRLLVQALLQWFREAQLASHSLIWIVSDPKKIWPSSITNDFVFLFLHFVDIHISFYG